MRDGLEWNGTGCDECGLDWTSHDDDNDGIMALGMAWHAWLGFWIDGFRRDTRTVYMEFLVSFMYFTRLTV